ncbi:serine hydrolase [Jannaschia sp. Os4]|uniref:serine hydrolase domain-containing protein n=1 Tax=Jannaschia sp. Os4 TaxID=2807617 RepID=UPI0019395CD8|nr:serine hydrolase [Jannaschia sp. Os4]MBM2577582.1 serine hydrolase [Jannaschia sp. Os4]
MRRILKLLGLAALATLLIVGAAALWKREEIARLWTVNTLFDEDRIVANFSDMGSAFLTAPLPGRDARALPACDAPLALPEGHADWIAADAVTGLVVLRGGCVAHETYHLGTGAEDRRISWSVAKSALSLLTGTLVADGTVALDDPVTRHAPQLAGSAYDGATLEDVLQMESGVRFDEDYLDPGSDINRMGRTLALGGTLDDFTAAISERDAAPGARWTYVSMDTHVIGMVLRGATGRSIADLMAERVTGPIGIADGAYLTDGAGAAFVLGGLTLRTRDYARLGLLVAQDGTWDGAQVVPAAWIDASTAPTAATADGAWGYGYQWWLAPDARPGEVIGRGVYGQWLYVDRIRDVVVAVNGADRGFRAPDAHADAIRHLRALADAAAG